MRFSYVKRVLFFLFLNILGAWAQDKKVVKKLEYSKDHNVTLWSDGSVDGVGRDFNKVAPLLKNHKAVDLMSLRFGYAAKLEDGGIVIWDVGSSIQPKKEILKVYTDKLRAHFSVEYRDGTFGSSVGSSVGIEYEVEVKDIAFTFDSMLALLKDGNVLVGPLNGRSSRVQNISKIVGNWKDVTSLKNLNSQSVLATSKRGSVYVLGNEYDNYFENKKVQKIYLSENQLVVLVAYEDESVSIFGFNKGEELLPLDFERAQTIDLRRFAILDKNHSLKILGSDYRQPINFVNVSDFFVKDGLLIANSLDGGLYSWANEYSKIDSKKEIQSIYMDDKQQHATVKYADGTYGVMPGGSVGLERSLDYKLIIQNLSEILVLLKNGSVVSTNKLTRIPSELLSNVKDIRALDKNGFVASFEEGGVVSWGVKFSSFNTTPVKVVYCDKDKKHCTFLHEDGTFSASIGDSVEKEYPVEVLSAVSNSVGSYFLLKDGTVFTYAAVGYTFGKNYERSAPSNLLKNVNLLCSGPHSVAAELKNNSYVSWGAVHFPLKPIRAIYSDKLKSHFTLVYEDGTCGTSGGASTEEEFPLRFKSAVSNGKAMAILYEDGSIETYGDVNAGGAGSAETYVFELKKTKQLYAANNSFVALNEEGNVFIWGENKYLSKIDPQAQNKVVDVAAITNDRGKNVYAFHLQDRSVYIPSYDELLRKDSWFGATWTAVNVSAIMGYRGFGQDLILNNVLQLRSDSKMFTAQILNQKEEVKWGFTKETQIAKQQLNIQLDDQLTVYSRSGSASLDKRGYLSSETLPEEMGYESSVGGARTRVLKDIVNVVTTEDAFLALAKNGDVQTWGSEFSGGDSSFLKSELHDVLQVVSTEKAFAALRNDGKVFTWGNTVYEDTLLKAVAGLENVKLLISNPYSFAALKTDGTLVAWGDSLFGGDLSRMSSLLTNVVDVKAMNRGFLALRSDNSCVFWGEESLELQFAQEAKLRFQNVKEIVSNQYAVGALKLDESVELFGDAEFGGVVDDNLKKELHNVKSLITSSSAFAALRTDGKVFAWGQPASGGDLQYSKQPLERIVNIRVLPGKMAFEAKHESGRLLRWGTLESN